MPAGQSWQLPTAWGSMLHPPLNLSQFSQAHYGFDFKRMFKVPWRLHVGRSVSTAGILAHAAGVPGYMGVFELRLLKEHVHIIQHPDL